MVSAAAGFVAHAVASVVAAPMLVNGDFQADRGPFGVPLGWVPFGDGAFEGRWEQGNWAAQAANPFPGHEIGLYQVVPGAVPGARYRLMARAKCGNPQLPVRIGLVPTRSANPSDAVWSADLTEDRWTTLSAEAVARGPSVTIILEMRNVNREHQLLQAAAWDDVTLEALGAPAPPSAATAPNAQAVPWKPDAAANDAYANLANLWSLAWPKPGVRTRMAGSHDPNPRSNSDFDRFEGTTTEDGETWTVLKSFTGPGALLRVWMTNFERAGRIRIYVDGDRVCDEKIVDFFGSPGVFTWPLANQTSGAWMSYVPIPFAKSARVVVKDAVKKSFYWQITYQVFDTADGVRPFTRPLNAIDARHLRTIQDQWGAATLDPKPPGAGQMEDRRSVSVPANATVTLWSQTGPGIVSALWIDPGSSDAGVLRGLRLQATWDNASTPQIDAPLDVFFGAGCGGTVVRGLLFGMAPPDGGYCYFPMPYLTAGKIELRNTTDMAIENVRFRVRWVPVAAEDVSPLRFHALTRHDREAGKDGLFVPLETRGRGHFVGLSAAMGHGNINDTHFLEGDEYIWVDGEAEPSTAGTGTEDYFTCGWYFFAGPITLAPIGCPSIDRKLNRASAYRIHVPDWVPFEHSIRFALEVGDSIRLEYGDYTTVAYYYLEAPARQ